MASVKMTFRNGVFLAKTTFLMRHVAKDAGFKWDNIQKLWYTRVAGRAARLREFADSDAKVELNRLYLQISPWAGAIPVPKGLTPYGFQIETAVPWALARNRSYLALDPGLGKTICAALYLNALSTVSTVAAVYVCPPFLMGNVELELKKWTTFKPRIARFTPYADFGANILLVPDSLIFKPEVVSMLTDWVATKRDRKNRLALLTDEAHRFKNADAKRTKALLEKIAPQFGDAVFMSGTPMPNRPLELFAVLNSGAPETINFRNYWEYGEYFCAGFKTEFGWDFSGASNLKELVGAVKSKFMLRMKKDDVLKELPPKTESIVFIDDTLPKKLAKLEKTVLETFRPDNISDVIGDTHLMTYRKELGFAKAKPTARFVRDVLTDSGESVLLFGIHKEAIAELAALLKDFHPLVITGNVDKDERFQRAQLFQSSPKHRLMILNIQAGGVGFNLTKASRVVFSEFSWVPGDNDQAADRAHRIGQKDNVLVQYLVYNGSLDALVLDTVMNKRRITRYV